MKHEYSTQQIEEASDLASNGYMRIGINFLLDFLDALPEPVSDEWQECGFEDIRESDHIRRGIGISWDSTRMRGEAGTPITATRWRNLAPAERERLVNFFKTHAQEMSSPTDDWQECGFEDIQKGDRVKRVRIYGSGTTDIREGVVANKDIHFASCTQKRILVSAEDLNSPIVKLYRIPAPVQHPDPDVHKYILDVDGDLWIWSKSQRKYIEPETLVQSAPADIDEWTPAKVVEDDR